MRYSETLAEWAYPITLGHGGRATLLVSEYGRSPWASGEQRRVLRQRGYEVCVLAEACPQFVPPYSGRALCVLRADGAVVARAEVPGGRDDEAAAVVAATLLLLDGPHWQPDAGPLPLA